jgi:hypothetical protein
MNKKITAALLTSLVALTATIISVEPVSAKGNNNDPWTLYQKNLNYVQKQANNAYRNQQYYNYNPYNPYPYNPYVYNPYANYVPYANPYVYNNAYVYGSNAGW